MFIFTQGHFFTASRDRGREREAGGRQRERNINVRKKH